MAEVILQFWEESESGWGCRPDGYSLHLTTKDLANYIKEYWESQPNGPAPHEYSRPCGNSKIVKLRKDSKLYKLLAKSKNGIKDYGKPPE